MTACIAETSNAISTLLAAPVSLRQLAVRLYGDANRVGLLADIRNQRTEHVSHAALHDLRRRMGLSYDVRHVVDVPSDQDADVHLHPGAGALRVHHVPDGAEVVIVPAGARVVQARQPSSKPARKRTRIDITGLPLNAQEARHILLWYLDIYTRIVPDGVDMTVEAAEILNAMRRHAFDAPDDSGSMCEQCA